MNPQWKDHLQQLGAQLDENGYVQFQPSREATDLAENGNIIVPVTHLGLINATGEEARTFLHNLTSSNIKSLPANSAQLSSLSGPKGRMLANFLVWQTGDGFRLALSTDLQTQILKKLGMYVLRTKVKLSDSSEVRILIGVAGEEAAKALAAAGLSVPADRFGMAQTAETSVIRLNEARFLIDTQADTAPALWNTLADAGLVATGTAAWQWLDIQAGIPWINATTTDEFVAQMVNYELLGGVSFDKGCFPGQEIIARTQHIGKVKKRMFAAHVPSDMAIAGGTDIYAPEFGTQSCGKVVLSAASPKEGTDLLVSMQLSAREAGEAHLGQPDGPQLTFLSLPYPVD